MQLYVMQFLYKWCIAEWFHILFYWFYTPTAWCWHNVSSTQNERKRRGHIFPFYFFQAKMMDMLSVYWIGNGILFFILRLNIFSVGVGESYMISLIKKIGICSTHLPNWAVAATVQPQQNTPDRKRETKIRRQYASMAIRLRYIHVALCIPGMPFLTNINVFVHVVHLRYVHIINTLNKYIAVKE